MDNTINSLVSQAVGGVSNQQIVDYLNANPNITGQQLQSVMQQYGVSPQQIASALSENAQQGGYQTQTLVNPESGQMNIDARNLGAGFNAYQGENGQTSGFSRVDPSRPGMIQLFGPNGEYRGEEKITSTTQDLIRNLGPIALAAGGSALAQGLLGGTSLGSLGGLGADSAFEAANAGASAMGDLGAFELANAGAGALGADALGSTLGSNVAGMGAGTGLTAGAAGLGLNAGTAGLGAEGLGAGLGAGAGLGGGLGSTLASLGTGVGGSLLGSTLGSTLGGVAGSTLGSTLGGTAGSTLGTGLGTALGTSLGTGLGLSALGTGLGAVANQQGISDARNLINQYGTQAQTSLADAYKNAQGLNTANRTDLGNIYANTSKNLQNLYNQQVGYQEPYQDIGRAASKGLLENQPYFTHQFNADDLKAGLAPNYDFMLQQGQMANQRAANAGGGALGGNALQGLQRYTQDYAGNAYQNAFNNYNTQRNNIYNSLAGMAGIGQTSTGQLANLGSNYGSNMAGLSSNYGGNLTTNAGQGIGAANAYGLNTANLATGLGSALASNATQTGANNASLLSNLGNTALLGSMLKAT